MTLSTPVKVLVGNVSYPSGPERLFYADLSIWESHDK